MDSFTCFQQICRVSLSHSYLDLCLSFKILLPINMTKESWSPQAT